MDLFFQRMEIAFEFEGDFRHLAAAFDDRGTQSGFFFFVEPGS
jgi:hypothetical protein